MWTMAVPVGGHFVWQIVRTYEHTENPHEDAKLQRCRGMLELAHDIAEAYQQRLVRL